MCRRCASCIGRTETCERDCGGVVHSPQMMTADGIQKGMETAHWIELNFGTLRLRRGGPRKPDRRSRRPFPDFPIKHLARDLTRFYQMLRNSIPVVLLLPCGCQPTVYRLLEPVNELPTNAVITNIDAYFGIWSAVRRIGG